MGCAFGSLLHDILKFIAFNVHFHSLLRRGSGTYVAESMVGDHRKALLEFKNFIESPAGARVEAHFSPSFSPCHRLLFLFRFPREFLSVSRLAFCSSRLVCIHTARRAKQREPEIPSSQPAETEPVLGKKNNNSIHAGRSEDKKKCVKVGRIKIAIKIRYYSYGASEKYKREE